MVVGAVAGTVAVVVSAVMVLDALVMLAVVMVAVVMVSLVAGRVIGAVACLRDGNAAEAEGDARDQAGGQTRGPVEHVGLHSLPSVCPEG